MLENFVSSLSLLGSRTWDALCFLFLDFLFYDLNVNSIVINVIKLYRWESLKSWIFVVVIAGFYLKSRPHLRYSEMNEHHAIFYKMCHFNISKILLHFFLYLTSCRMVFSNINMVWVILNKTRNKSLGTR